MYVRGKECQITKHAYEGMRGERAPITLSDVARALERPDDDDGRTAHAWIKGRTIIVRYEEALDYVRIRSVSATRSRFSPKVP